MPVGPRIRSNSEFGLITDNPLTAGATTFNSARLSLMPVVSAAHAVVTLDPRAINGEPEIVIITAHTAAATVATITRGAYGTVARSHPVGTEWIHAPLDEDFIEILTAATRPSDPYRGQAIFQTDTNSFFARTTADTWANINMLADPPACQATRATQALANGSDVFISFTDADTYDTDNMHSTTVTPTRITMNTAGLYIITFFGNINAAGHVPELARVLIRQNGTTDVGGATHDHDRGDSSLPIGASTTAICIVGTFFEVIVTQTNSGGLSKDLLTSRFSATWVGRG